MSDSVLFGKQRKIHPRGMRVGLTQKRQRVEKPLAQFWLLFLYAFSPPPEPDPCKLG